MKVTSLPTIDIGNLQDSRIEQMSENDWSSKATNRCSFEGIWIRLPQKSRHQPKIGKNHISIQFLID
jgi:hypothetical protein